MARHWLSQGAEVLVRELQQAPADALHCELLIVGSGYGGAVAAARLAGARPTGGGDPIRVVVLERGREYLPGMFPARFADLPGHVRFSSEDGQPARGRSEGLFDLRLGADTSVLVANGLGGGSLINAAVMARPRDEAFASGWPSGIDGAALAPAYEAAEHMLQASDFAGTPEPPKLAALFELGRAMGAEHIERARLAICPPAPRGAPPPARPSAAGVARSPCLQCGDCVTGCNHRAKQSLDVNYLKLAHDRGARVFCGATVHDLAPRGDGRPGWAVRFFFTDRSKGYADAPLFTVNAERVILAAGALGSTEILLRCRDRLPLSARLGEGVSGNGDAIAVARHQRMPAQASAREEDPFDGRGIGPTINGMVFHRNAAAPPGRNPWLLFQEFAIPGALRRLLAEVSATAGLLSEVLRADPSTHRADAQGDDPAVAGDASLDHTAIYGMQGDDGASARLRLVVPDRDAPLADGQVAIVRSKERDGDFGDSPLYGAQLARLHVAHAASDRLGGLVVPNPLWEIVPGLPVPHRTTTVHPLGGCGMADDVAHGVVDACGRVFRRGGGTLEGLAVLDGAIVPRALGVNPALTIAALAEHALAGLRVAWQLEAAPHAPPAPSDQPAWVDLPTPRAPTATCVELRERLTGTLTIAGTRYDASLVVEFAPIDALLQTVARLPRVVDLNATLTLDARDGQQPAEVVLRGQARVLHRADSTPLERILAVARERHEDDPDPGNPDDARAAQYSQFGEVRTIDYALTVARDPRSAATAPLRPGDRLLLHKRLAYSLRTSPWRQLSEGEVALTTSSGRVAAGRLALDPGWLAEQAVPLVRVLAQHDQPSALGDLAALALLAARLVLKTHLLTVFEAIGVQAARSAAGERLPGLLRYLDGGVLREVRPERVELGRAPQRSLLSRYLPPAPPRGRPVLLLHGLGASGSTFAHWSIGADAAEPAAARSEPLVASLLRAGREVWVLELRTSIALEQRVHWPMETVAREDIGPAVDAVLARCHADGRPEIAQVDVVAHCIGAAMFCVAVLEDAPPGRPPLHGRIGAVVLSQVGPLMRLSATNRFRGYLASYLRQFVGRQVFDVRPPATPLQPLIDGLLATFPYPDGDRERERAEAVPGFQVIRHRADAIWGLLMQLDRVGDATLARLDAIYGWVVAETLAQTIHFARHRLITDASGANRVISQRNLAERFAFPVLLLHGQDNAMFDWQGAYDSFWLLKRTFADDPEPPPLRPPAVGADGLVLGGGTPRQLRVIPGYGHQDCLIGETAHRDVFPHVTAFLDLHAPGDAPATERRTPQLVADLPWFGPTLGWVRPTGDGLSLDCRLGLRASPARAETLALVFVPARRDAAGWHFDLDHAVAMTAPADLAGRAVDVRLALAAMPAHDGFAVLTVHNDIPVARGPDIRHGTEAPAGLFVRPRQQPNDDTRRAVECALAHARIDLGVVRFDAPWAVDTGTPAPGDALRFVLASCQYPAGLVDRAPADASYQRLARRLADDVAPPQWLLLLGDQIYADETAGLFDPGDGSDIDRSYELCWHLPGFRAVTRALPTGVMLDDHEIADNWEPGRARPAPAGVAAAFAAYRAQQHKLLPDAARDQPFRFRIFPAGFPVFVLDARTRRQARRLGGGPAGAPLERAAMLPPAVLDELATWLAACPPDAPKFIASPSVVLPVARQALDGDPAERLGLDDWSGYAASLAALLDLVVRGRHRHVIFLSGDAHLSLVGSLALELGDGSSLDVHTVVSSGLYAPWPFANAKPQDLALDGPIAYRHADGAFAGRMHTAACGTAQGYAIVSVRRAAGGGWLLAVELDQADGRTLCERDLGPDGPRGPWRTRRP